jgi:hypothetical protein
MTPWFLANIIMRCEFEIALWCDPPYEQKRARVVLGKLGTIKNAWGPC